MIPLIPRERWPYSKQIKLWLDKLLSSSLDLSLGNNFFIYVCLSSCSFVVCFLLSFARYLTSFSNMYVLLNKILHSHGLVNDIYWFLNCYGEMLWMRKGMILFVLLQTRSFCWLGRKEKTNETLKSDFKVKLTAVLPWLGLEKKKVNRWIIES